MAKLSLPLTRLVHENLSIVMNFCFSRQALEQLVDKRFKGEWKYLRKALLSVSEQRAEKACIELAVFLRLLDDEEDMSRYLEETSGRSFGILIMKNKSIRRLKLRDVVNKIIHASAFKWDFSVENRPLLICESRNTEKWVQAEINVVSLAAFCGLLMS